MGDRCDEAVNVASHLEMHNLPVTERKAVLCRGGVLAADVVDAEAGGETDTNLVIMNKGLSGCDSVPVVAIRDNMVGERPCIVEAAGKEVADM